MIETILYVLLGAVGMMAIIRTVDWVNERKQHKSAEIEARKALDALPDLSVQELILQIRSYALEENIGDFDVDALTDSFLNSLLDTAAKRGRGIVAKLNKLKSEESENGYVVTLHESSDITPGFIKFISDSESS